MRGRTNKLVDGCYGWFAGGGMFSVLESTLEVEDWKQEDDEKVWKAKEEKALESNANGKDGESSTKVAEDGSSDSENGWSTDEEDDDDGEYRFRIRFG